MHRLARFLSLLLALLALLGSLPAQAATHALIMTISEYQGGVPPLKGVKVDTQSARAIAHAMGVRDEDMLELHDSALTLEGMRKAFDDLDARVQPGDSVFIYYSGHGGRQLVHDPEERCAESLVTVDRKGFVDAELEAHLNKLSVRTQKIIMFLDACHSGGATTRALHPGTSALYAAKSLDENVCAKPVNVLTRSLTRGMGSPGSGALNYVYIAAAQDNEVSLDQPGKGGVATQAWLACIAGEARDLDGSGGITADEVRQCAQDKINASLKNAKGYLPHHISITGNASAVLSFAKAPVATPVVPEVTPTGAAYGTLQDIYSGRDDRRVVSLKPVRGDLKIGRDNVGFNLTSSHAGYVYLLMVGSDGKTFDLLFPNKIDRDHYIKAGEVLELPRSSWEVQAQGPAGKDTLLAIVAESPRDFSALGLQPAGPFSVVQATAASSKDIQIVSGVSANAASMECSDKTQKRTLAVQQKCSNAYGAALATVREVP